MNRPQGVTVIAVLYFVRAAFFACLGLIFMVAGAAVATAIAERSGLPAALIAGAGVLVAVLLFCFSAFQALVGWGLLRLKEWARIIAIALSALSLALGVFGLFRLSLFGVLRIAISGVILWYLLQPHVVAAFRGLPATTVPPVPPSVPRP